MSKPLKKVRQEREARVALTKQFLQQRAAMARVALTDVEYVAFRLGCSLAQAEDYVAQAKEENRS